MEEFLQSGRQGSKRYEMLLFIKAHLQLGHFAPCFCMSIDGARSLARMAKTLGLIPKIRVKVAKGMRKQPYTTRRQIWVEFRLED